MEEFKNQLIQMLIFYNCINSLNDVAIKNFSDNNYFYKELKVKLINDKIVYFYLREDQNKHFTFCFSKDKDKYYFKEPLSLEDFQIFYQNVNSYFSLFIFKSDKFKIDYFSYPSTPLVLLHLSEKLQWSISNNKQGLYLRNFKNNNLIQIKSWMLKNKSSFFKSSLDGVFRYHKDHIEISELLKKSKKTKHHLFCKIKFNFDFTYEIIFFIKHPYESPLITVYSKKNKMTHGYFDDDFNNGIELINKEYLKKPLSRIKSQHAYHLDIPESRVNRNIKDIISLHDKYKSIQLSDDIITNSNLLLEYQQDIKQIKNLYEESEDLLDKNKTIPPSLLHQMRHNLKKAQDLYNDSKRNYHKLRVDFIQSTDKMLKKVA
jgi:hypothetical protein